MDLDKNSHHGELCEKRQWPIHISLVKQESPVMGQMLSVSANGHHGPPRYVSVDTWNLGCIQVLQVLSVCWRINYSSVELPEFRA